MEATRLKSTEAAPHHLLLALCRTTDSYGQAFLRNRGVNYGRMLSFMESEGLLKIQQQEQQPAEGDSEEEGEEGEEVRTTNAVLAGIMGQVDQARLWIGGKKIDELTEVQRIGLRTQLEAWNFQPVPVLQA